MDKKKSKRKEFEFDTSPEDTRNIAVLSELLHLSKSASVRLVIRNAVEILKKGKGIGNIFGE
jgi:hypothetical protein